MDRDCKGMVSLISGLGSTLGVSVNSLCLCGEGFSRDIATTETPRTHGDAECNFNLSHYLEPGNGASSIFSEGSAKSSAALRLIQMFGMKPQRQDRGSRRERREGTGPA